MAGYDALADIKQGAANHPMPNHPHMLLATLMGAIFIWTSLRSRKAVWFSYEVSRTAKPLMYLLSVALGGCLMIAGLFYAFR